MQGRKKAKNVTFTQIKMNYRLNISLLEALQICYKLDDVLFFNSILFKHYQIHLGAIVKLMEIG